MQVQGGLSKFEIEIAIVCFCNIFCTDQQFKMAKLNKAIKTALSSQWYNYFYTTFPIPFHPMKAHLDSEIL